MVFFYRIYISHLGLNKTGTGLGLVICKKLVSLLGPYDKIEVQSKIGVGTKISFLLNFIVTEV
jgi:signal transduction histidine kinase